jgi:hypothetical protein
MGRRRRHGRTADRYLAYCTDNNLTLWWVLEDLLDEAERR